jgi:hypothetical protein
VHEPTISAFMAMRPGSADADKASTDSAIPARYFIVQGAIVTTTVSMNWPTDRTL